MREAIIIDPSDDVATALAPLAAGQTLELDRGEERVSATVSENIPYGHKFALRAIAKGSAVHKYGAEIGLATADIAPGGHVHVHNITSNRFRGDRREA